MVVVSKHGNKICFPEREVIESKVIADKPTFPHYVKFAEDRDLLMDLIYNNNMNLFHKMYTKYPEMNEKQTLAKNKRSLMSCFFQTIENDILYKAYKYLEKVKIIEGNRVCLEYDGLCVPKPNIEFDKDKLVRDLNKEILSKTGLRYVSFKIKGYSDAFDDIIEQRKTMIETVDVEECAYNDLDACEKLFKLYPDWVCCHDQLYVYDRGEGIWSNTTTSHLKVIQKYATKLFIVNEKGIISTTNSYGNTLRLMELMPKILKTLCINNNWMKDKESSGLGKLLFNNGYYDMKQGLFFPKNKENEFYTPEIVFFGKIHHDYSIPTKDELKYCKYVKKTLFHTPLDEEVGDHLLLNLSMGFAGEIMKKIFFGLGVKDSGKISSN